MSLRTCLAAGVLLLVGCSEGGTVAPLDADVRPVAINHALPQATPHSGSELDPPNDWPAKINWATGHVELPTGTQFPAPARIIGRMNYNAYHASIGAQVVHRDSAGNAVVREFEPEERHQFWNYHNNEHTVEWPILIPNSCGNSLEASLNYKAWYLGVRAGGERISLDEAKTNRHPYAYQEPCGCANQQRGGDGSEADENGGITPRDGSTVPGCPNNPGGPGGGGGGSGTPYCYTVYTDHYWYYPASGTYEYRFTTTTTVCHGNDM